LPVNNSLQSSELLKGYQRLLEISRDLASTLDLGALLDRIVHAAADLTDAQAASILLYDSLSQQLYFQAATNIDEPSMRGLLVPLDSLAGWIVQNRQPVMIADVRKDARHFGKIGQTTQFETYSLLGVPLITKDKVIGVLEALNKRQGEFTPADQDLLSALGGQAAAAIENTRLFQQSDLISEFVHELRTPLSSLNTAAHLLNRPELSDEQRERMITTIQGETLRLSEMASAFLDLARLESGRVQFNMESFELPPVLQESAAILRARALEKEQQLTLAHPPDLPPLVADRNKVKQVVINLLSNAVKYTPARGAIHLSAEADEQEMRILVRDTGRGISPEGLAHLFQKFYRVPGSEKIAPGTGLGLSICKKIIEGHGGEIGVHSQVDEGTTFIVHLPLKS
jgi:signal transduction histidine kinase